MKVKKERWTQREMDLWLFYTSPEKGHQPWETWKTEDRKVRGNSETIILPNPPENVTSFLQKPIFFWRLSPDLQATALSLFSALPLLVFHSLTVAYMLSGSFCLQGGGEWEGSPAKRWYLCQTLWFGYSRSHCWSGMAPSGLLFPQTHTSLSRLLWLNGSLSNELGCPEIRDSC